MKLERKGKKDRKIVQMVKMGLFRLRTHLHKF